QVRVVGRRSSADVEEWKTAHHWDHARQRFDRAEWIAERARDLANIGCLKRGLTDLVAPAADRDLYGRSRSAVLVWPRLRRGHRRRLDRLTRNGRSSGRLLLMEHDACTDPRCDRPAASTRRNEVPSAHGALRLPGKGLLAVYQQHAHHGPVLVDLEL